ncbi:MAG TPA: hypothetical protein VM536_19830, partial [Chloroflexia bacterium]|nr:hypothetical protein [Chloroflexia bacterium]
MRRDEMRGLLLAAGAVGFLSTSPVLAIWADPLSPFVKTGGRLAVAAVILGAAVGAGQARRVGTGDTDAATAATPTAAEGIAPRTRRATLVRFVGYGLIAALHFLAYIASLSYTSPAHSLTLVYTAPIFVAL